MNQSIMQSRLFSLNIDLLRTIFEYDNTREQEHKKIFANMIRQDIWCTSWKLWRSKQDLYTGVVMDHLMLHWGVYGPCDTAKYFINFIFPNGIQVESGEDFSGKKWYTVFCDGREVFTGYVLNQEQENAEVWGDGNWTEINKMHVYTDYENKLYVYQSC